MGDALKRVVSRAISDAAFRRQLQNDPKAALKEFELSAAEMNALTSGDATKLTALGIDQRMSRMLMIDSAGAGGLGRLDTSYGQANPVIDAGAPGGGGLERVDISNATGVTGDELDRLSGDPAQSTGVWATEDAYGTGRLDRVDGAQAGADLDVNETGGGGDQLPGGGAEHTTI